ncbi:MAG TPA: class A beta-lactamase [Thermoanaerobaculia bacterium]
MLTLILAAALTLPPQKSDATLGVTAIHLETGQRISVRGAERFPMGSVYKFPIAIEALHQVDEGKLAMSQKVTIEPKDFGPGHSPLRDAANGKAITHTVGELIEAMVVHSDNTACDTLLKMIGGPAAVTKRMLAMNVKNVRIDRSERGMSNDLRKERGRETYATDPRDTSTPDAMVELLLAFWNKRDGLKPASHDLLFKHMADSPTGPRKLRAAVPQGWTIAHKTGSMPGTSNDVGILISPDGKHHIAIAIFTKSAKSSDDKTVDADIANAVRAVLTHFEAVER